MGTQDGRGGVMGMGSAMRQHKMRQEIAQNEAKLRRMDALIDSLESLAIEVMEECTLIDPDMGAELKRRWNEREAEYERKRAALIPKDSK